MPRIFMAIKAPPVLQQALEEVQASFQPLPLAWRWVLPSHLHVTLKFLGDVPESRLDAVFGALTRAASTQAPFVLTARTLGCFPGPARPRVLWMGLDDPHRGLANVYQQLESALADVGFPPEARPFHPHLTLARVRRPLACPPFIDLLSTYQTRCFGTVEVDRIEVFQSQLQPTGAIYTALHTVLL